MKLNAYMIINKVAGGKVFVEAADIDEAFDIALPKGTLDSAFGEVLHKSLFEIVQVYWKSEVVRGRFTTKEKAEQACRDKGVCASTVGRYSVK